MSPAKRNAWGSVEVGRWGLAGSVVLFLVLAQFVSSEWVLAVSGASVIIFAGWTLAAWSEWRGVKKSQDRPPGSRD